MLFLRGFRVRPLLAFSYTYSSSLNGRDLYTDVVAGGYAGEPTVNVTINGGVQIGSTSTATPGLTIGAASWPAGVTINFTNAGTLNGRGGAGAGAASTGGTGGKALFINSAFSGTLNVTNNSGAEINGGGGGGGGGKTCQVCQLTFPKACATNCTASGGAGGLGYGNAAQASGSSGQTCACHSSCGGTSIAGTGGTGGAKGAAGSAGTSGSFCPSGSGPGSGGAAGAAIDGISLINLTNNGTINGSQIN
jgi:Phage tail fibre adhesin Gp38